MNANAPRPGRMHTEEVRLITGEAGLDFVILGRSVPEIFVARLMDGSDTLEIIWTGSLGRGTLVNRIARAEVLAGGAGQFRRISGYGSDTLGDLIREGRFNAESFARDLGGKLGGTWIVKTTPRPHSVPPTWNVTATRIGDLP